MAYRIERLLLTLNELKVTFPVVNLCNTHNSGKIACFNHSMFTHKLERAPGLWFKLYCHRQ